jgi:hypothetical protein
MPEGGDLIVEPDAFRTSRDGQVLVARLDAALAICLYDDRQGVGGLLHLRYVATDGERPLDLTDNTLSSNLLLMERFCTELRSAGARKQSWRTSILAHVPLTRALDEPAATVIDLAQAYFAEGRRPVDCKEFRRTAGVLVCLDTSLGRIRVGDAPAVPLQP